MHDDERASRLKWNSKQLTLCYFESPNSVLRILRFATLLKIPGAVVGNKIILKQMFAARHKCIYYIFAPVCAFILDQYYFYCPIHPNNGCVFLPYHISFNNSLHLSYAYISAICSAGVNSADINHLFLQRNNEWKRDIQGLWLTEGGASTPEQLSRSCFGTWKALIFFPLLSLKNWKNNITSQSVSCGCVHINSWNPSPTGRCQGQAFCKSYFKIFLLHGELQWGHLAH